MVGDSRRRRAPQRAGDDGRMGMGRTHEERELRELEHRLRNELFGLQLRGDVATDDAVGRRAELKARLADIRVRLAEKSVTARLLLLSAVIVAAIPSVAHAADVSVTYNVDAKALRADTPA